LPVVELLRVNNAVRRSIAKRELDDVAPPMTLAQAAQGLVKANLTNDAEIRRVLGFEH
jgi:hypothetical protein